MLVGERCVDPPAREHFERCATDRLILIIVKELNLVQLACAWVTGELKDLNMLFFTTYQSQFSTWFMPAQVRIPSCKADPLKARTSRLV